ncbi:MAG: hypothetical protein AAFZ67_08490 [Planctomycetota bacterium]
MSPWRTGIYKKAFSFTLRGLSSEIREVALVDSQLRLLFGFRGAYLGTFHLPIVVPFLSFLCTPIDLSTQPSAESAMTSGIGWALASLSAASLTMVISEAPFGHFADRKGPANALKIGIGLMVLAMLGFIFAGLWRANGVIDQTGGIAAAFALEILVGLALSLVNGADTTFTRSVISSNERLAPHSNALEGVFSAIRSYGAAAAIGAGALLAKVLATAADNPSALLTSLGILFLGTCATQLVAFSLLRRLAAQLPPPVPATSRAGMALASAGVWREGVSTMARRLLSLFWIFNKSPRMFVRIWFLAAGLGMIGYTMYAFQNPLLRYAADASSDASRVLVPVIMAVFLAAHSGGAFMAALGSKHFARHAVRHPPLIPFADDRWVSTLVVVGVAFIPLMLTGVGLTYPSDIAWLACFAVALFSYSWIRGFVEPYVRTNLCMQDELDGAENATLLISSFNVLQRLFNSLIFGLMSAILLLSGRGEALEDTAAEAGSATQAPVQALDQPPPDSHGPAIPTEVENLLVALLVFLGLTLAGFAAFQLRRQVVKPSVVVIGSYRKHLAGMLSFCRFLEDNNIRVAHPRSDAVFGSTDEEFVRLNTDVSADEAIVQRQVFERMEMADAVVLYNPDGYVGNSGALEIGLALRGTTPVVTTNTPSDVTIRKLTSSHGELVNSRLRRALLRWRALELQQHPPLQIGQSLRIDDQEQQIDRILQTSTSWVIFTPKHAAKIRKPVDLGYINHLTRESRAISSEKEFEIGRKAAGDVYVGLGVLRGTTIHVADALGEGTGEPAVIMHRLDDQLQTDRLLASGKLDEGGVRAIAAALWRLHDGAPRDEALAGRGSLGNVLALWLQLWEAPGLADFQHKGDRRDMSKLVSTTSEWLDRNRAILDSRIRDGRIRDGHGDVRLEQVFLDRDRAAILDPVEFSDAIRFCDTAADVAFFIMDLEVTNKERGPSLGKAFLDEYKNLSDDRKIDDVLPFYKRYRAVVRAKVNALAALQSPTPKQQEDLSRLMRGFLDYARTQDLGPHR